MNIPLSDIIKSIPGTIGIRLETDLPYKVIKTIDKIEIRQYQPFTLARVKSIGEFDQTQDENFKQLADFIFGNNKTGKRTHMTTPVFHDQTEEGWIMSFYLPWEFAGLKPQDGKIWIEEKSAKTVAVYRYSGNNDLEKMQEAKEHLISTVLSLGLDPESEVWWAQYDQPFALPFVKRNEAMVRVSHI